MYVSHYVTAVVTLWLVYLHDNCKSVLIDVIKSVILNDCQQFRKKTSFLFYLDPCKPADKNV